MNNSVFHSQLFKKEKEEKKKRKKGNKIQQKN